MNLSDKYRTNNFEDDPYWEIDGANQFRPKLDTREFFTLTGYNFCYFLYCTIPFTEVEKTKGNILSYGQKTLYHWSNLESQVLNGGFTQFYFNGYGKYVSTIIKGLVFIEDHKMADLVSRSYQFYLNEQSKIEDARESGFVGFSKLYEKTDDLGSLDTEFYNLNDATKKIIENYARQNPNEFFDDKIGEAIESKFSGDYKTLFVNNTIKEIIPISKGLVNGIYKSYYENGNLRHEINYLDGEQTGERKEYYNNGNKKSTIIKSKTSNQITHSEFFENGNRKSTIIEYSKSDRKIKDCWKEDGTQIMKDGTGLYIREASYFNNKTTRYEMEIKDNIRHGKQCTYQNGILTLYQEMVDGKVHGVSKIYNSEGVLIEEIEHNYGQEISRRRF